MNKFKILAIMFVMTKFVSALPTLAIPNLIYPAEIYQHNINNSDISGAIISSGKFKIIETPKGFDLKTLEILAVSNPPMESRNLLSESKESAIVASNTESVPVVLQDGVSYILIGEVVTIDENENEFQIKNTDTSSITHHIAVMTSYKLIRAKDKAHVAAFSAYGSASQMKLITAGAKSRSLGFNRALLLHELSKDLAKSVLEQLLSQFESTAKFEQNDHPVITDVKTYAD